MTKRNLTEYSKQKYRHVVDEWFVNGFNGAAAYRAFYPKVKKEEVASVNFSQLQKIPEIKKYILEKHEEARRMVQTTHEGILQELQRWIQSDITETINLTPEEIKKLPIEIRRLITKFKTTSKSYYDKEGNLSETTETIELHFVSKERAIEMINKHLGFYELDNTQKASEISIYTSNNKHKTIVKNIISGK